MDFEDEGYQTLALETFRQPEIDLEPEESDGRGLDELKNRIVSAMRKINIRGVSEKALDPVIKFVEEHLLEIPDLELKSECGLLLGAYLYRSYDPKIGKSAQFDRTLDNLAAAIISPPNVLSKIDVLRYYRFWVNLLAPKS